MPLCVFAGFINQTRTRGKRDPSSILRSSQYILYIHSFETKTRTEEIGRTEISASVFRFP